MEELEEVVSHPKARTRRSLLKAALWALKISLACNGLLVLVIMVLGSMPEVIYRVHLPDWILPGYALWNVMFGGPWYESVFWFVSVITLNVIVYFGLVFAAEGIFLLWRRSLHPIDNNSHIPTR